MKLIGGNVNDVPVKSIRDGSAFGVAAAAGGGGVPSMLTLGSFSTPVSVAVTGWGKPASARSALGTTLAAGHTCSYEILREGSLLFMLHIRDSDDKLFSGSIPISSDLLGTATTAVDLSGDFTDNDAAATFWIGVNTDPLVTDGIIIAKFHQTSVRHVEVGYYTIAADGTPTKVGSIINHNLATDSAASSYCPGLSISSDGNSGIVWCINNHSTNQLQAIPFNFKTNQGFGTAVATGVTLDDGSQSRSTQGLIDGDTNKVISRSAGNRIHEWVLAPGTTPAISHTKDHSLAASQGIWAANFGHGPGTLGTRNGFMQKETPDDVLQFVLITDQLTDSFSGVTHGSHRAKWNSGAQNLPFRDQPAAVPAWNGQTGQYVHHSFSADGEWTRGFIGNCGQWRESPYGYPPMRATAVNIHLQTGLVYQEPNAVIYESVKDATGSTGYFGPLNLNRSLMQWFIFGDNLYCLTEDMNNLTVHDYSFYAAITDPDA